MFGIRPDLKVSFCINDEKGLNYSMVKIAQKEFNQPAPQGTEPGSLKHVHAQRVLQGQA